MPGGTMSDRLVRAHDNLTNKPADVPWRWVDNPAILHGRYTSKPTAKANPESTGEPAQTSRSKRGPVKNKAASEAADATDTPATGDSTEES